MRLGVIDVGSNTVHLLVVDAHPGAHPLPAFSHKRELRLAEHMDGDRIAPAGADQLTGFIAECVEVSEDQGVQELMAFATSAIREADNTEQVLEQVRASTGVDLRVLSGDAESRLTFLAARRWFGWSAGRIVLFDIGGGSLEIATGIDEDADAALSLPLGAGRLSRQLTGDPPSSDDLKALRKQVRAEVGSVMRDITRFGEPQKAVASSKTFRALARACGAASSSEGIYVPRQLRRTDLAALVTRLAAMPAPKRANLPGISATRASQVLAGAVVAEATMDLFGVETLDISPWALREGVILNRLDRMDITGDRA